MHPAKAGALWGAFCADAYALGAHWVYDADEIAAAALDWEGYNDPVTGYHAGRHAGDFTHYGDQMLWLLESIALEGEFALNTYAERWEAYMRSYDGYIDNASEATLRALDNGADALHCGSHSKELSAAGRTAPLLCIFDDMVPLLNAVQLLTRFTHHSDEVEEASRYFAEVAFELLQGGGLETTLFAVAQNYSERLQRTVKVGRASVHMETTEAIREFGQSCGTSAGFPGVIHLVLKYGGDYRATMEANVRAGGDSAARGMVAGMLLGAGGGAEAIPAGWIAALHDHDFIVKLMGMIDG